MYIKKIQVEGGFLDGLDLEFQKGLNAIIGARGTGKSTLVELIRFALGVEAHSSDSNKKSLSHARTALQDGEVTITISDGHEDFTISRMANDDVPEIPKNFSLPMIFSQTEVENIGLLSSGRLGLIDAFIDNKSEYAREEQLNIVQIKSLSKELWQLINEVNDAEEQLLKLPLIEMELKELKPKEDSIALISKDAKDKTIELDKLTQEINKITKLTEYEYEYISANQDWLEKLGDNIRSANIDSQWSGEKDSLGYIKAQRDALIENLSRTFDSLIKIQDEALQAHDQKLHKKHELSTKIQKLRVEIEKMQEGAGEIVRLGQRLKAEKSQLETLTERLKQRKQRISGLLMERDSYLDSLESLRAKRSEKRSLFANNLSALLAPKINIEIEEAGQIEEYINVLIEAFKGSGIKYKDLAPSIAKSIPPRELLSIVENDRIDDMTSLISISKDRASRLIQALKDSVLSEIATVLLEDEVKFQLLDGSDFKDFNELSTGQRCTVILPIILEHRDTVLIVDQPEDHIDNAFIVDTLISAILRRAGTSQLIVTTHNANIPVLGEAMQVVHLSSDGKRGFVEAYGSLETKKVVNAISDVMEGGEQAFERRASFYKKAFHV